MATWAYECRGGTDGESVWFVPRTVVDELPPGVNHVQVKVGREWLPAVVDRTQPVAVEGMLVREVIADEAG
jgi:hypothetical protein